MGGTYCDTFTDQCGVDSMWRGFVLKMFLALESTSNTIQKVQEPDVLLYTMLEIHPKSYNFFSASIHGNKAN